jgi:hypothetical protein
MKTVSERIAEAALLVTALHPEFSDHEIEDTVFNLVFGPWTGSDQDRENLGLIVAMGY